LNEKDNFLKALIKVFLMSNTMDYMEIKHILAGPRFFKFLNKLLIVIVRKKIY
jgi:hypothetical protein